MPSTRSASLAADHDRLLDLLDAWQQGRDSGREPTPDELCPNDAGLRELLREHVAAARALEPNDSSTLSPAPGESATETDLPPAPPGYRLLARVAAGGMGVVYAAEDTAIGREVAVKLLKPSLAGRRELAARFFREARITGRLQHPGVPPIHALGQLPDGQPFLAMKLIRGRTLADWLAKRSDPAAALPHLVQVFEHICLTVGYAHAEGVVHRDLKPANVMVGEFGEVQVLDWGLAKDLREGEGACDPDIGTPASAEPPVGSHVPNAPATSSPARTAFGRVMVTPAYMPPEQARGEPVGARADVFALGGILCTILTGKPPHAGRGPDLVAAAAAGQLADALDRLARCGADAELVALAARCLAPSPNDRPADGKAVAGAVTAYRAGVEERLRIADAQRAAAEARLAEQRRKRRWQLAAVAIGAVLLAGAGGTAWWQDKKDADHRHERAARDSDERERLTRNGDAINLLLDACDDALRNDDPPATRRSLEQAERRMADGGDEHRPRAARCRADLTILAEFHRIEQARWLTVGGAVSKLDADAAAWAAAFRDYGIVPGVTAPADAAGRINASPVRERLLAILDTWLVSAPNADLLALLCTTDPDAYRVALRTAVQAKSNAQIRELFEQPESRNQPVSFTLAMSAMDAVSLAQREHVLLAVYDRRASEFSVLMALGDLYPINQPKTAAARVRWYQAAATARPTSSPAWNRLGLALSDQGDMAGAVHSYREAIRIDPSFSIPHYNLAGALSKLDKWDDSAAAYREAIRLNPNDDAAHYNLGGVLRGRNRLGEAAAAYREAIRLNPNNDAAHTQLGNVLYDDRKYAAAVAAHREAIRLNPSYAPAHFNLGNALWGENKMAEAVAEYHEAVRLDPTFAGPHARLGTALLNKGDFPGAIREYRETIRLDATHAPTFNRFGLALKGDGQLDEAVQAFEEAIRLDKNVVQFRINLGDALMAQKKFAAAIEAYEKADQLRPKGIVTYNRLGLAWRAKGDLDRVVRAGARARRRRRRGEAKPGRDAGAQGRSGRQNRTASARGQPVTARPPCALPC